jgi:hypothetical protein
MAVKKCPKCDGVVSRLVRVCPHCGAKIASGTGTEIGLVLGLLVLAAAVVLVIKGAGSIAPKQPTPTTRTVPPVEKPTPPPPAPPTPPAPAPVVETPPPAPQPVEKPALTRGMTMAAVRQLWGAPEKTSSAQSATTRSDWWTYDDGQKLHFVDSVLESWAQSEPPATVTTPEPTSPSGEAAGAAAPASREEQIYGELRVALKRAEVEDRASGVANSRRAKLEQSYTSDVRSRYGITEARQETILAQGEAKHWRVPPAVFFPQQGGAPLTIGATYVTGMPIEVTLGDRPPGEGIVSVGMLAPGCPLRVQRSVEMGGAIWYYVEVLNETGVVMRAGWTRGLTVMTAPPESSSPRQPAGAR